MGTKLVLPGVGTLCAICYGTPGEGFGRKHTPAEIRVVVAGISKGADWLPEFGEPGNGSYLLQQTADCTFAFFGDNEVAFIWEVDKTRADLKNEANFITFSVDDGEICARQLSNRMQNPDHEFFGGTMNIEV